MKITYTFRGLGSSEAIKNYAKKRFSRLEKYFHGEPEVSVIFKREKFREIVEVVIHGDGERINTTEETTDIYEAIDLASDSLEKQLKRIKEKKKSHRREKDTFEEPSETRERKYFVRTEEINHLSTKEAVDLFLKEDKGYFLFYNTDYDRICLVYYEGGKPVVVVPEFG